MDTGEMQQTRPLDVVLAVLLSALGSVLMVMNIAGTDPAVRVDSHSWLMLPVFLAATLPVLWWRRGIITVTAISCVAMLVHVSAFGHLVRCGAGLPLAFVLAFLSGMAYAGLQPGLVALTLTGVLGALVLVWDTAAGLEILPVVLVLLGGLFGIGRVVAHRSRLARDLRQRNEDLRLLRDERAALEVGDDRARLSAQLETLLDQRLSQLASAAERGALAEADTRALLVTLEEDSRRTLGDMREIVGLLRGGEVSLAPAPSVAHLDALLAKHLRAGSRLRVTGDPRVLPASVELSAYRIVEHLVMALAQDPPGAVDVGMRFEDDALEILVSGPVPRGADMRGAVARVRERTLLHAGSLDVKVTRGRARVVAHLPVLSGA